LNIQALTSAAPSATARTSANPLNDALADGAATSNATRPGSASLVAKRQTGTVFRTTADFDRWFYTKGNPQLIGKTLYANGVGDLASRDALMLAGLVYINKGSKLPGTIPSVAGSLLSELGAKYKTYVAAVNSGNRIKIKDALYDLQEARSEGYKYANKYIRSDEIQLPPGLRSVEA
jgi:hypothetical protein